MGASSSSSRRPTRMPWPLGRWAPTARTSTPFLPLGTPRTRLPSRPTDSRSCSRTTALQAPDRRGGTVADGSNFTVLAEGSSPSWGPMPATCRGRLATIVGTDGDDTLTGTSGGDVIVGLGGSDHITGRVATTTSGRAGNDDIWGGDAFDRISGNAGNDMLNGGLGRDCWRRRGQARTSSPPADSIAVCPKPRSPRRHPASCPVAKAGLS